MSNAKINTFEDLMWIVAEKIFDLQNVGIVNGEVVYTDVDMGGVFKFKLDLEKIIKIIKDCGLTVYNDDDGRWNARNDSARVHCCGDNFEIIVCSAALFVKGWREGQ